MHTLRLALVLLCSLPGACTYVDPDPDWTERELTFGDASAFAVEARELRGIDAPALANRVEKGDRILYGVEFHKRGKSRNWLVYVEVTDPKFQTWKKRDGTETHSMKLDVRVCDEAGLEVGRDEVLMSREQLVFGLMRACRGEEDPEPVPKPVFFGWIRVSERAQFALRNMLQVIRESEVLYDILWQVIDTPSIGSVIKNLGVRVSLESHFDKARAIDPITVEGRVYETFEVPVELQLNRTPALRCKLRVTEPSSPLNLSAGILSIAAFQPSDPSARVSIWVLAARRAAPAHPQE